MIEPSQTHSDLGKFFQSVQIKALRQAQFATRSFEDAEDLVQEAMIRLGQSYGSRAEEWEPLFHRILQNLIRDYYRRAKIRQFVTFQIGDSESNFEDSIPDIEGGPDRALESQRLNSTVQKAITKLPLRQQQCFLLRCWWEYDVKQTAEIMRCSEGSVKTHCHRAIQKLQSELRE